jgi:hypothetical protein
MAGPTRTDAPWIRATKAWLKAHESAEKAKLQLEKARFRLTLLAGDASASGAGVSVTRYFRAGTIDYGRIEMLKGVSLDLYRRAGDWSWRVGKADD